MHYFLSRLDVFSEEPTKGVVTLICVNNEKRYFAFLKKINKKKKGKKNHIGCIASCLRGEGFRTN